MNNIVVNPTPCARSLARALSLSLFGEKNPTPLSLSTKPQITTEFSRLLLAFLLHNTTEAVPIPSFCACVPTRVISAGDRFRF